VVASASGSLLLERDAELEYLSERLGEARRGRGGVVAIEGPAEIGKSRLLAATVAVAGELGLGVLRARGGELEAALLAGGGGRRAVSS
jgi:hypothetical protein